MASSPITLRPMLASDVPAALTIQALCYPPFLVEEKVPFTSRLWVNPSFCVAAVKDGELVGYILAHGWTRHAPPALGAELPVEAANEILFIHDLSIGPWGRGFGLGNKLVSHVFQQASEAGLEEAELIAVEGAETYWRTLGFAEERPSEALAKKIVAYGKDAKWMTRDLSSEATLSW